MRIDFSALIFFSFVIAAFPMFGQQELLVEAASKPGRPWTAYPTRTLDQLPVAAKQKTDSHFSKYGGTLNRTTNATGFFYPAKVDGRWWLVDPDGALFIHKGVASVYTPNGRGSKAAFKKKFHSEKQWAAQAATLLQEHAFNGLGSWGELPLLRTVPKPLVYTTMAAFMSGYGKQRGGVYRKPGHTGFPNDCIFVFDPGFEIYCDRRARELAKLKNDPWLLGHFSDNELPFKLTALRGYLALSKREPGYQAAWKWLQTRYGKNATMENITLQDEIEFLTLVVDRYFRIVSSALKKHDPNHLFLGSKFYGSDLRSPEIFRAAGRYTDVISVNYYNAWTPDLEKMKMWEQESRRPIVITEWYVKGMDSGLPNTGGAGWTVKTQRDRGLFYGNFVFGLLESKVIVGWHWFKYADDDPTEKAPSPAYAASNKGIVDWRYAPHTELLQSMKAINERTYFLADFFDGK